MKKLLKATWKFLVGALAVVVAAVIVWLHKQNNALTAQNNINNEIVYKDLEISRRVYESKVEAERQRITELETSDVIAEFMRRFGGKP